MDEAPKGTPKLNAALAKAQAVIKGAVKDKTNPAFKSKYASMDSNVEAIREAFAANDLGFRHRLASDDATTTVTCIVFHASGEEIDSGSLRLPVVQKTPQAFASAITYGRRYTLEAAAGLAPTDDDDGNAASKAPSAAPAGVEKLKQQATEPAASTADGRTHDGALVFRFGNGKGTPLAQLDDNSVSWYREALKRDAADPAKAQWAAKATQALATVEAELRFRGLPV